MKIRNGFVSNSSSSSFIIGIANSTADKRGVLFESVENAFTCNVEDLENVFDRIDNYPSSAIAHRGDIAPLLDKILGNKNGKSV